MMGRMRKQIALAIKLIILNFNAIANPINILKKEFSAISCRQSF
jgi:hypothetical protein